MIVDMMRNDLGRIADVGTVDVAALFDVERYRMVLQMTSTVTANVRDRTLTDVLRALFPSGSVTGAPKIATMQMIAQLEDAPREVYCGAIGVVEPGGNCTFAAHVRTSILPWMKKQFAERSMSSWQRRTPPNTVVVCSLQ